MFYFEATLITYICNLCKRPLHLRCSLLLLNYFAAADITQFFLVPGCITNVIIHKCIICMEIRTRFLHRIKEKMKILFRHRYHAMLSRLLVCLFNELATRGSERSVPVSFIQMVLMMYIPHPVTSHKTSTFCSMQPDNDNPFRPDTSLLTSPVRHYFLLTVCDSCLGGEQNSLSNQLISCWDGSGKRRRPQEDGKSFHLPLFFFSVFAVSHLLQSFKLLEITRWVSPLISLHSCLFVFSDCLRV